ncbi:MAG: 23S rRNA (guanosine(2251)-2'-O)-methyltransferase RlmB [Candidatus Limnocylindrus sp.]
MDEQRRPPRPGARPGARPTVGPSVRPPARSWTPRPDGPRHWTSKRTIPAQALTLVGPDQELIAGRHPVEEAFSARREAIKLLVVPQRRAALQQVVLHATTLRIPIVEVEGALIGQLAGFDGHQGIALVVRRRPEVAPEEILARAVSRGEPPFILALDGVEDPQNFGSLIRSAEAVGVHGILMATRGSAPLSPAAIKASAGAVEHLLVARVENLAEELTALRLRGIRVVGAEAEAAQDHRSADLRGPICLVIGSEGKGLSPAIRRRIDLYVRIPMVGRVASLNASVAGSILLFEVLGQRPKSAAQAVPPVGDHPPLSGSDDNPSD